MHSAGAATWLRRVGVCVPPGVGAVMSATSEQHSATGPDSGRAPRRLPRPSLALIGAVLVGSLALTSLVIVVQARQGGVAAPATTGVEIGATAISNAERAAATPPVVTTTPLAIGPHRVRLTPSASRGLTDSSTNAYVSTIVMGLVAAVGLLSLLTQRIAPPAAAASNSQLSRADPAEPIRAMLDVLPVGVLALDQDGRLALSNPAARRLLSIQHQGAESRALARAIPSHAVREALLHMRVALNDAAREVVCDDEQGLRRIRLTPLRSAGLGLLAVSVEPLSDAREAESRRDEFISRIVHELRTPLTCIRAYAETLNADFFDDEASIRRCYHVIMRETQRLTRLINDVLSLSSIEAGAMQLRMMTIRIDNSLREAIEELQPLADGKSIQLRLECVGRHTITGDAERLGQVWLNLIGNAVKYSPADGVVTIRVTGAAGVVRVEIEDRGIGIAPAHHERIFEKFFRVTSSNAAIEPGTGLGMPIARELIRLHGGDIHVRSALAEGTTFVVELPVSAICTVPGNSEESGHVTNCAG